MDDGGRSPLNRRRSLSGYVPNGYETEERPQLPNRVNLRGNAKRRQRHRRLSIINGHIFDVDVSSCCNYLNSDHLLLYVIEVITLDIILHYYTRLITICSILNEKS